MDINDIDSLLDYIESHHTIIEDRDEVLSYFHEYACLMCKYDGIDYHKADRLVHNLIIDRLRTTALAVRQNYMMYPTSYIRLNQLLAQVDPEEVVRREHGGGKGIVPHKEYESLDEWFRDNR